MTVTALTAPLDKASILAALDGDGYVTGVVTIDLDDLIGGDLEDVLDLFSEGLIGSCLGQDISYKAVGADDDGNVLVEVSLDPSSVLDEDEDDG